MFLNGSVEDKKFITQPVLSNSSYYDGIFDVELHPAFDTLFRLSQASEQQNSTIELAETQADIKKEPTNEALNFNGGNDEARLGLLAVHNFCTPFLFFLRKTALRQVVHRDVTSPHFVRSSHLPKSAELAKAILTTINSAIKKSHTRWLLLMAGLTLSGSNFLKDIITTSIPLKLRKYAI